MTNQLATKFIKLFLTLGVVVSIIAVIVAWAVPNTLSVGYTDHALGPIGPADRDMLYKVKQAGLWEMPVGQEAATRAVTVEFREVGERIAEEHHELDRLVNEVAEQLGVELPTEPSPDQQVWMTQISQSNSANYDRTAVFLLRQAHGKVLPLLAQVRSGTRNALIRQFADEGMTYVNRHMSYLDGTGLVNYAMLPEPPAPSAYQQPSVANYFYSRDPRTIAVGIIVSGAVLVLFTILAVSIYNQQRPNTSGNARKRPSPMTKTEVVSAVSSSQVSPPTSRHRKAP